MLRNGRFVRNSHSMANRKRLRHTEVDPSVEECFGPSPGELVISIPACRDHGGSTNVEERLRETCRHVPREELTCTRGTGEQDYKMRADVDVDVELRGGQELNGTASG